MWLPNFDASPISSDNFHAQLRPAVMEAHSSYKMLENKDALL